MRWHFIILFLCTASLMAGCAAAHLPAASQASSDYIALQPGQTIGQTLVADSGGLEGLRVYLKSSTAASGTLVLRLRTEPGSDQDLTVGRLLVTPGMPANFYAVPFTPQADSSQRYYYARLEYEGQGPVDLGVATGDGYLDGALYQEDQPQDAQLSFQLAYAPLLASWSFALNAFRWCGYPVLGLLLFLVPGWALVDLLWPAKELNWAEKLGVAAGLGIGVYPLLMLWTNQAGWFWGRGYAWVPLAVSSLWLLGRYRPWQKRPAPAWATWRRSLDFWPDAVWLILMALVAVTRFLNAANLEMPLWDDSVSHLLIVQRILETGGLFSSWLPYAPFQTLTTQFGFHADVAAWAWLTGMDAAHAQVVTGQVLNVLAVLALYPLAYRLFGRWAGSLTALVAGLVSWLPGYYINWGRFPQLTGQVALPVAAWWLWMLFYRNKARRWEWVIGGMLVAGMALAYYRMVFYLLAFGVAVVLIRLATNPGSLVKRRLWIIMLGAALWTGVLTMPWLGKIVSSRADFIVMPRAADMSVRIKQLYASWPPWVLGFGLVGWLCVVILLVVGGPVLKRHRELDAALGPIWLLCLASLPLLRLTPLPGVSVIEAFSILISAYIPLAIFAAAVGGYLVEQLARHGRWNRLGSGLLAMAVLGAGLIGAPSQSTLMDRDFDLSTRPDLRAAAWIKTHVPPDAFFLINGQPYDLYGTSLASDAGTWLPYWTGRGTDIPAHYAFNEQPNLPDYKQTINQLVRKLMDAGPASREGLAAICAFPYPITHVYLGQRQGRVFRMLPPAMRVVQPLLPPQALLKSPDFHLIYHQDRVYVFEFDRSVCVQQ